MSRMNIDIPILRQKLEASINIQKPDEQNINGVLIMKMSDREVSVKGSLLTNKYRSSQFGKMVEQTLKLSISLPSPKYSEVQAEFLMRKPTNSYTNMQVEGTVTVPQGTSKVALRYELPTKSSNTVAVEWLVDSRLVSREVIKGAIEAENLSLKHFAIQLRYRNNEVKLLWDLATKYRVEAFAHLPNFLHESSPLRFTAEGTFNLPKEFTIRSTISCSKSSSNLEASIVKNSQGYNIRAFLDSPRAMTEPQEILVKLQQTDNGRFVVDVSGVRGKKSFSATGEFVIQDNVMSISGKVSGSYGAHFIQVSGRRNGRMLEIELNGESLSLLKGKKVNISVNVHPTQTGFTANMDCRTKKSVHSASINADFQPRAAIVSMKISSPDFEPVLMEAQYTKDQDAFIGKLMANVMGEPHNFEVSLNKRDLEAKFNVQSPYIPSQEFNAHVKSVVDKNNVNIVGDLSWNAIHWRFEGTAMFDHFKNMEAKLEIITPFKSFDRVTIGGKLAADEIIVELYTPLDSFPNSMFQLSGIPFYDTIDSTNFHPKFIIGFPWAKYSVAGKVLYFKFSTKYLECIEKF